LVRDEPLADFVRGQLDLGAGFLILSNFEEEHRPEVLRVIREDLLPATEKEYPGMGAVDMVRELVEMEKRWSAARPVPGAPSAEHETLTEPEPAPAPDTPEAAVDTPIESLSLPPASEDSHGPARRGWFERIRRHRG
jgi:hypothetical protein